MCIRDSCRSNFFCTAIYILNKNFFSPIFHWAIYTLNQTFFTCFFFNFCFCRFLAGVSLNIFTRTIHGQAVLRKSFSIYLFLAYLFLLNAAECADAMLRCYNTLRVITCQKIIVVNQWIYYHTVITILQHLWTLNQITCCKIITWNCGYIYDAIDIWRQ